MTKFQFKPQYKEYTMFRMFTRTRDRFKFAAEKLGLSIIDLLDQLSEQLVQAVEDKNDELPIEFPAEETKEDKAQTKETK